MKVTPIEGNNLNVEIRRQVQTISQAHRKTVSNKQTIKLSCIHSISGSKDGRFKTFKSLRRSTPYNIYKDLFFFKENEQNNRKSEKANSPYERIIERLKEEKFKSYCLESDLSRKQAKDSQKYLLLGSTNEKSLRILRQLAQKPQFDFLLVGKLSPDDFLLSSNIMLASQDPCEIIVFLIQNGFSSTPLSQLLEEIKDPKLARDRQKQKDDKKRQEQQRQKKIKEEKEQKEKEQREQKEQEQKEIKDIRKQRNVQIQVNLDKGQDKIELQNQINKEENRQKGNIVLIQPIRSQGGIKIPEQNIQIPASQTAKVLTTKIEEQKDEKCRQDVANQEEENNQILDTAICAIISVPEGQTIESMQRDLFKQNEPKKQNITSSTSLQDYLRPTLVVQKAQPKEVDKIVDILPIDSPRYKQTISNNQTYQKQPLIQKISKKDITPGQNSLKNSDNQPQTSKKQQQKQGLQPASNKITPNHSQNNFSSSPNLNHIPPVYANNGQRKQPRKYGGTVLKEQKSTGKNKNPFKPAVEKSFLKSSLSQKNSASSISKKKETYSDEYKHSQQEKMQNTNKKKKKEVVKSKSSYPSSNQLAGSSQYVSSGNRTSRRLMHKPSIEDRLEIISDYRANREGYPSNGLGITIDVKPRERTDMSNKQTEEGERERSRQFKV